MSMAFSPLMDRLVTSSCAGYNDVQGSNSSVALLGNELSILFNSTGVGVLCELPQTSQVTRSVLNYGFGCFAGTLLSNIDLKKLEVRIRTLISHFEPRIVGHSFEVRWLPGSSGTSNVKFLLQGEMRGLNAFTPFRLQSSWNTESGEVSVQSYGAHHG